MIEMVHTKCDSPRAMALLDDGYSKKSRGSDEGSDMGWEKS